MASGLVTVQVTPLILQQALAAHVRQDAGDSLAGRIDHLGNLSPKVYRPKETIESLRREMKMNVLLGGNRFSVARGRTETPAIQYRDYFVFDAEADGFQQPGFCNCAFRVDRDFHNHVAMNARRNRRALH